MSNNVENNQKEQENNNSKVAKHYEGAINKLRAILGCNEITIPTTVNRDSVTDLVAELFQEENQANYEQMKTKLKDLLRSHVQMKNEIENKRKELNALETKKQKEFTTACEAVFKGIDGLGDIVKSYASSLQSGITGEEETK